MPACHWTVDFACGTRREVMGGKFSPDGPSTAQSAEGRNAAQRAQPCCKPRRTQAKRCAGARASFGRIAGSSSVKIPVVHPPSGFCHSGSGHACTPHYCTRTFQMILRKTRFQEAQHPQACQARPLRRRLRLAASSPEPECSCHNGFICPLASLIAAVVLRQHRDKVRA